MKRIISSSVRVRLVLQTKRKQVPLYRMQTIHTDPSSGFFGCFAWNCEFLCGFPPGRSAAAALTVRRVSSCPGPQSTSEFTQARPRTDGANVLLDSKERKMEPIHVTEEGVEWKHSATPKQFKQQTHDVQNHKETPALESDSTAEDISDLGSIHSKEEVIDPELEAACIKDETTEPILESDPFAADVNELGSGYNLREVPEHKITLDMDQEPQSNPCPHCQFSFSEEHLEKHIKDTHPEQIPAADSPCSCSVCGRSFSRPYSLKEHQRIHTRETPYHCSECDQSFGRLFSFKQHQQLHRDEAPFHCSDCGKSFRESGALRKHRQIHTGEAPYHCTECGSSFREAGSLTTHKRIHTGERPYHCTECGKRFRVAWSLQAHLRIHKGETPFLCGETPYHCTECGKGFKQSGTLKKHQRIHAGENPPALHRP